ncbi:MAG: type II toxin-antitoxin system VapC family toxin [Actinobacteria bacterium]|nr:type II toxin-antitoxin system VapC family toxin [Actinomycetota bacterium]
MTTVVDASALLDALLGVVREDDRHHFSGDLAAPDLLFPEVTNALACMRRRGLVDPAGAALILEELRDVPLQVEPTRELVVRAFELSDRLTASDGCYVALAESFQCPLLTADCRLGNAPGLSIPVILV